jgi:surface antigen
LGEGVNARSGDYDDSTIITAYNDYNDDADGYISETGLVRIWGSSTGNSEKWGDTQESAQVPKNTTDVKKYTVKKGESIQSISDKFGVSMDAILWANDLSSRDDLSVGQVLKVPPISGVVHHVVSGDTISAIATKYDVDSSDIVSVNHLQDAWSITIGMDLMIPGAIKHTRVAVAPPVKPKPEKEVPSKSSLPPKKIDEKAPPPKAVPKPADVRNSKNTESSSTISSKTGLKDRYSVKYTGKWRGFAPGNCTWYVAQNKSVTWRGNANEWLRNARADGVPTGDTPVPGAIIQFGGKWYNRYYGHVGIVADVTDEHIIVKDMNYRGLYEVTIRKIPRDASSIAWYIYVD